MSSTAYRAAVVNKHGMPDGTASPLRRICASSRPAGPRSKADEHEYPLDPLSDEGAVKCRVSRVVGRERRWSVRRSRAVMWEVASRRARPGSRPVSGPSLSLRRWTESSRSAVFGQSGTEKRYKVAAASPDEETQIAD